MGVHNLERVGGTGRVKHLVAELAQRGDRVSAHAVLVFHHQDGDAPVPGGHRGAFILSELWRGPPYIAGKVDSDRRAFTNLAFDRHVPAGLAHEAVDLAQPEPGAGPALLGGEERVERLIDHLGGHASAGVANGDEHILAGHEAGPGGLRLVQHGVGGLDDELAAIRHGIARVDHEVEHRVLELVAVGVGLPQFVGQNGLEPDRLAEAAPQKLRHAGHQLVGVELRRRERLLAGKGEQLLDQRGGAPAALLGARQIFFDFDVALGEAPRREIEAADDNGEHVVEVVRDAAGQLTDRFHLAGLAQRLLGVRPPLHFRGEFARALEYAILQRLRERAQFLFGMIALAFALAQLVGCVREREADRVDLAHRELARNDRPALPEGRCLGGQGLHRAGHAIADRISEQHGKHGQQQSDRSECPQRAIQARARGSIRNARKHHPAR